MPRALLTLLSYFHMTDFRRFVQHLTQPVQILSGSTCVKILGLVLFFLYLCQVFFTRNGKIIGKKDAVVPPGGFYPTIGMLSSGEKVKVDLHPLSG